MPEEFFGEEQIDFVNKENPLLRRCNYVFLLVAYAIELSIAAVLVVQQNLLHVISQLSLVRIVQPLSYLSERPVHHEVLDTQFSEHLYKIFVVSSTQQTRVTHAEDLIAHKSEVAR